MNGAEQVLSHARGHEPRLSSTRLICLDGPSGSGKTTLAGEIAAFSGATVVHTDELLEGWDGLPALPAALQALLGPLAEGSTGRAPRYDWTQGRYAGEVVLEPVPLVVLDGVGSGARVLAGFTTTLVWLDGDVTLRRTRALERDGEDFRPHWEAWATAEQAYFASDDPAGRADVTLHLC